jgi:tripeptide aminopeptidase
METTKLLARYGFKASDLNEFSSDCKFHACELLQRTLYNIGITPYQLENVSEERFAAGLQEASRQVERFGGEYLINPLMGELPLADIDLHMRGICRWLNELGIYTLYSCEGHGRRVPRIGTLMRLTSKQDELLRALAPNEMTIRFRGKEIHLDCGSSIEHLLQFAERIYEVSVDPKGLMLYEAERFKNLLIELLSIPGESNNEGEIRQQILGKMRRPSDDLFMDRDGNVCATIYCGEGPTVLLSAHMDMYQELDMDRKIIQNGTILYSTKGILGADDRAGVAVLVELANKIHRTTFNGTLKLAFTVKEEIGLIGSQKLEPCFLSDVDAAIVVDRRGARDIVTSYSGVVPFCSQEYGMIFEKAGKLAGMEDWKVTAGGSSDAKILAQKFGIPSVNLSAGYKNEHTEREQVDYVCTYQTLKLIESVFHHQLIEVRNKEDFWNMIK